MKEKDEIEDLFASAFEDFSMEPPASVKTSIDRKISTRSYTKLWVVATVLVFILFALLFFFTRNDSTSTGKPKHASNNISVPSSQEGLEKGANISVKTKSSSNEAFNADTAALPAAITSAIDEKEETNKEGVIPTIKTDKQKNNEKKVLSTKKNQQKNVSFEQNVGSTSSPSKNKKTANKQSLDKKSSDPKRSISTNPVQEIQRSNNQSKSQKLDLSNSSIPPASIATNSKVSIPTASKTTNPLDQIVNTEGTTKSTTDSVQEQKIDNGKEDINKEVVENKVTKNIEANKSAKADSSIVPSDSTTNIAKTDKEKSDTAATAITPPIETKATKTPSLHTWLLSAHAGNTFRSTNTEQLNYKLSESKTYFANLEVAYFIQNKYIIQSGLQLNKTKSDLQWSTSTSSTKIIGYDSTYVDSTLVLTPISQTTVDSLTANQSYQLSSVGIPLSIGYSQKIGSHFYLDATISILYKFQKATMLASDSALALPTIQKNGMNVCLRPQIRYQFDHFGISISSTFGYNSTPILQYSTFTRIPWYSEVGVGVHYQF